jgi:glycosyltransferase involved in cell wall biosynthesis/GT2 family glycosyltransferase
VAHPLVSVNMCMYNSSRYVSETLDSVFAQSLQDFEIVIVDDGSTDGSPELVEREFPDSRITIVRRQHVTLRVARPLALAHSSGEFIAFLDSDDLWVPDKLARQVAAARERPEPGLIFSDCDLVDASSRPLGRRFSDQFDYRAIDFSGTRGHVELLRCGNFIASPTPLVSADALRAAGGFNHSYRHVNDFELWLRLARRYPMRFIDESLAQYRVHDAQFTQCRWEITLPEQCALIRPMLRSASYPAAVRVALGDNLLGQHRLAARGLWKQRRYRLAACAALGMCRYPDRVGDYVRHWIAGTRAGRLNEAAIAAYHRGRAGADWAVRRGADHGATAVRRIALRARRAPRRVVRILRGQEPIVRRGRVASVAPPSNVAPATHVWVDGSPLGREQTGYFNLLTELLRGLARHESPRYVVHVVAQASGRAALAGRLGDEGAAIRFHPIAWRAMHWSHVHRIMVGWQAQLLFAWTSALLIAAGIASGRFMVTGAGTTIALAQIAVMLDAIVAQWGDVWGRPRVPYAARFVRFLWRTLPAPRRKAPCPGTVEILFWRGRFRWRDSHRIAIVQDMTTRIHPELHTDGNVVEFDEFLGYVQRHAQTIATVSEQSRRDIVDRIAVCPESVAVMPMPVHPQYVTPRFSRGLVAALGIAGPYVLCVGAIEPRKNLRRLVRAFELLKEEDAAKGLTLVIVGPQGWDSGFREFVSASDAAPRVRMPGFVPLDHLPSLYHHASAVICPSVYEGFGIPVMEAMCSSAIVLASRISSLPEVLGADGMLFNPYQTEDIARALLYALTLPEADAAAYRRRCRKRAEAHLERVVHEGPLPGRPVARAVGRT